MAKRKVLTPLKAIRAKCVDCSGGHFKEVRGCPVEDCALWLFRFGKNPARKGVGGRVKIDSESCTPNSLRENETNGDQRDMVCAGGGGRPPGAGAQNGREGGKRYPPIEELTPGGSTVT